MDDNETIGEYKCPNCGVLPITNPQDVTIIYPKRLEEPAAKITCDSCNEELLTEVTWDDAVTFDFRGSPVVGFSFSRGPVITEPEIVAFVDNLDKEINEFFESAKNR